MPTATQFKESQLVTLLLSGLAGGGKSTLAYNAPGPIAALLVDKPIVADLPVQTPGYDPSQIYWKAYSPPDSNLSDEKAAKPRNVADEIMRDLQAIKNAFVKKAESVSIGGEQWPLPRTLIVEGGDFIAHHVENWVLNIAKLRDMSEFEDKFQGWRQRYNKLNDIYDLLTSLPSAHLCNVVVTTGVDEESKMVRNDRGKMELVKTGNVDPDLGGKMSVEGPRKFANSFLCLAEAGKWWVVTKPSGKYAKYRGVRSGGFGLADVIDVTIDPKKPENIWTRLFT